MKLFIKMVETWVRKGSRVALVRLGWIGKPLAFICGVVVVLGLGYLALFLVATMVAQPLLLVGALVIISVFMPCEAWAPLWGSALLIMVVGPMIPSILSALPIVLSIWGILLAVKTMQGGRRVS